jgi:hypothetical protein
MEFLSFAPDRPDGFSSQDDDSSSSRNEWLRRKEHESRPMLLLQDIRHGKVSVHTNSTEIFFFYYRTIADAMPMNEPTLLLLSLMSTTNRMIAERFLDLSHCATETEHCRKEHE